MAVDLEEGPAESLYTESFYNTMRSALRKGGIICTQVREEWCVNERESVSGSIWI